jgi:hypothetical protein
MKTIILTVCCLALASCATAASSSKKTAKTVSKATSVAGSETREGFGDAVSAPIEDLNLKREPIPAPLDKMAYPYTTTPALRCREIAKEVAELDAVLGTDFDTIEDGESSWGERGGEAIADVMLDTVRGLTTGFIPYRGVLREATGAASYDRKRGRAFQLGYARRAYLKGLGQGLGCEPPAAPFLLQVEPEDEAIIEKKKLERRKEKRWTAPSPSAAFQGKK